MTTRLLVVDKSPITLIGIRVFLEDTNIRIVAELDSCRDLCRHVIEHCPDVVVLSFCVSARESIDHTRQIRQVSRDTQVILVTDSDSPVFLAHARDAGANEVIVGNLNRRRLLDAIGRAVAGKSCWPVREIRRLAAVTKAKYDGKNLDVPLTQREFDVLRCLTNGKTNRQIAEELSIGYETVKEHVHHLLEKIGVEDRTQAAVWAVRKRLA